MNVKFVWDAEKERLNREKHGVDFHQARLVFLDPKRKIFKDEKHSCEEERFFCIGKAGAEILTVRFVYRNDEIRIIGAGFWRKGRSYYEEKKD